MAGSWNARGIGTRIVATTLVVLILVVGVNYVVFAAGYRTRAQTAMIEQAKLFTAVADQTKDHVSLLHSSKDFDTGILAAELKSDLAVGKPASQTRLFQTIPVVAGWTVAKEAAKRENVDFRIAAFDARNKTNQPASGSFDEKLLRELSETMASGKGETAFGIDPATNSLHFMRAIKLNETCMSCHGDPGSKFDTTGTGKDLTGHAMEGWKVGQMHGGYQVIMPLAPITAQVTSFITNGLIWSVPLAVIAAGILVYLTVRMIGRPLNALTACTAEIAKGDLTQDVPAHLRQRRDEIGGLAGAMQSMTQNLRIILRDLSGGVRTLASSSNGLTTTSKDMHNGAKSTSDMAHTVAAAAEEMSANTASVAAGMEQTTTNLASVATATEEMTATVAEIASNSERARSITSEATQQAAKATELVKQLGEAAREVGKVTETISNISSQTNLLALNATIEAARAGTAGKGFAVVANEIKQLALQTATATEDIKQKISGIQASTASTVQDIDAINAVIKQVGEIVTTIATAIEEQSTVTKDIAGNIAQASAGVRDVNDRVAQTASVSQSIAKDIAKVNQASTEIAGGSEQVEASAGNLALLADKLQAMTEKFKFRDAEVQS
jgi:methyl-accepting chemotaxis protein